jgi:hypothetical protein
MLHKLHKGTSQPLEDYLSNRVFAADSSTTIAPDPGDVEGYTAFIERYKKGLAIERAAVDALK